MDLKAIAMYAMLNFPPKKWLRFILKAKISCSETPATVGNNGIIFTLTNFVTLKYQTDSWGTGENGFEMVITAFKDAEEYGCR